MEVVIRTAREEDLSQIIDLEKSCFKKDAYPLLYFRYFLSSNRCTFLVAELNKQIIGYAISSIEMKSGHLISIAVHPNYRRKGIGTMLLSRLIESLSQRGVSNIWLEVRKSNISAQMLYKKFGFRITGKIARYYGDEDAYIMSKNMLFYREKST